MNLLYPWLFFLFIPLFLFYKSEGTIKDRKKNLLYLSLLFTIIALSRPVISNTLNDQKFDAEDFIIALDASYSMQADDLKPTRYEVAKQNIKKILNNSAQNRFSIFAFTTNAMLISPPTTDTALSMIALDSLEPQYILTKGTSLSNLLKTISKINYENKRLIIFSDGGEEHNLEPLVNICKTNHIIPFVVATGSSDGAILSKNSTNIKDEQNNLVISRINPILKDFATLSGGKYYKLESSNQDISSKIMADIKTNKNKKTDIKVLSYKELFYIPLIFAIITFFVSITKLHLLYVFIPLLLLPQKIDASLLDFYYLDSANSYYKSSQFIKSAKEFDKLSPSVRSYYNSATAYYEARDYKKAIKIYLSIKTTDEKIKQNIFYNLGNCAVKLKKYDRAKIYYQKALSISYDEDSFYNLSLLYKLNIKQKKDISNLLPKKESNQQTQAQKKKNTKQDKSSSGNSNKSQKAGESSNGSSNAKKQKSKENIQKNSAINKSKYKIGYKAYELINKGYTNEKHPW